MDMVLQSEHITISLSLSIISCYEVVAILLLDKHLQSSTAMLIPSVIEQQGHAGNVFPTLLLVFIVLQLDLQVISYTMLWVP